MKTILDLQNLSIGYTLKKKVTVITSDISLTINSPKLIGLLGENGIGKSTLLRTISRVQPFLSGKILLDNKSILDYSALELSKKISIVLTEKIPANNLMVYELIALGRQVYTNWIGTLTALDKTFIDKAILMTEISSIQNKRLDELSDGQYQKVMIARALAQDTPIIILDEPTAHLDIINKLSVFNLLQKLVLQGKTIILSTHELQLALQYADDLWLMGKEKFETGNTKGLLKNNALQNLFSSENVFFDNKTKQFSINKTMS